MYNRLIVTTAILGIMLFVINAMASVFYWYVSMPWFDMFMHTLGGVFVGVLGGAVLFNYLKPLSYRELFIVLALFVFIVGLGWEYYEYIVQFYIKSVKLAYIADSISDLIFDMVGGVLGILFVIALKKRYNRSQ